MRMWVTLLMAAVFLAGCPSSEDEARQAMQARQSQAVSNMRAISAAQLVYRAKHGSYGTVGDLIARGLLDSAWDQSASGAGKLDPGGVRRGAFKYSMFGGGAGKSTYAVFAEPAEGSSYSYGMTKDGMIYEGNAPNLTAGEKVETFSGNVAGFEILQ